jgi:hypothetical protein
MESERGFDRTNRTDPDIQVTPVREDVVALEQAPPQVVTPRDRVRWGPIWAGIITALTTFLVLELLMFALGLLTVDINPNTTANSTGPWITAMIGLIAFFFGGWVAGATSAVRGTSVGLLNGFLVWGLGTVLILAFSAFGLGQLLGTLGTAVSRFLALGNPNFSLQLGNIDQEQIAELVRNTAWWAFLSLAISALTAALGGWVGVKSGPLGKLPAIKRTH